MISEDILGEIENSSEKPALGRLIALGRKKSFITIDDILEFFPDAEQDVDQLEEAFSALNNAGITYIDSSSLTEPSDEELAERNKRVREIIKTLDDLKVEIY